MKVGVQVLGNTLEVHGSTRNYIKNMEVHGSRHCWKSGVQKIE